MITSVHLPLLVSLLLAVVSPVLAARLSPPHAAAALVAASAAAALASTSWALMVLAATWGRAAPLLSARGALGAQVLEPAPVVIAVAVLIGLAVAVVRVVIVVHRRRRVTRALRAVCATCGVGREELVVVPIADPHAFAVPARCGRGASGGGQILVTAGMLRALDAPGRRALLAHERAHLTGHHHRQRAIAEVAAALNPLLIPARTAVAYLVERAADEHAASTIGDRRGAAHALATAALAGTTPTATPPDAALAYTRFGVARRVAALHAAPLPERRLPPILLIALAVFTAAQTVHAVADFSVTDFSVAGLTHLLLPGS